MSGKQPRASPSAKCCSYTGSVMTPPLYTTKTTWNRSFSNPNPQIQTASRSHLRNHPSWLNRGHRRYLVRFSIQSRIRLVPSRRCGKIHRLTLRWSMGRWFHIGTIPKPKRRRRRMMCSNYRLRGILGRWGILVLQKIGDALTKSAVDDQYSTNRFE